jgi:hypothetical protein
VPITVGLGETQSYQVSVPIKLPCRAAGTKVTALNFFLSNEDGDPCDLLQDRFEAVVVVEWSIWKKISVEEKTAWHFQSRKHSTRI